MQSFLCSDCNSKIKLNQKFCKKCGAELVWEKRKEAIEQEETRSYNFPIVLSIIYPILGLLSIIIKSSGLSGLVFFTGIIYCLVAMIYKRLNKSLTPQEKASINNSISVIAGTIILLMILSSGKY